MSVMVRTTYRDWLRSTHSIFRATTQTLRYDGPPCLVPSGTAVVVSPGGVGVVATASTPVSPGDQIGLIISERRASGNVLNAAVLYHGIVNYDKLPAETRSLFDQHQPQEFVVVRPASVSPYTSEYRDTY